jgi:YHS domain-containing protein
MRLSIAMLGMLVAGYAGTAAADTARQGDVYPLDRCIVSGEELGSKGEAVSRVYDGREVRFCCEGCIQEFEANKEKYLQKADAEIIAQQKDRYPLTQCVVMPEDEIDPKLDYVVNNRLVRVCCRDCVKDIAKEPAKYLAEIDKAVIEKQKASYPLDTCVVSGEKLDGSHGEPVEYVTGNRLVRFCCKDCIAAFEKNPQQYLKKLDEAEKAKAAPQA